MKRYKLESGKGASPLYAQIKDILLSNIEEGIYKDKIPTEKQLQELFQVSRITVRQAIDELVSDGYLVRERAKGTRIVKKKIAENLNSLCNFTNEMKKKNIKKVLLIATGALFSPTMLYQKENILSIAHAISLEAI